MTSSENERAPTEPARTSSASWCSATSRRARSAGGCRPASHPSRTATCTSGTPRRSALDFGIAARVRRHLQPPLRRHQPRHRGHRVRRGASSTTSAGWASSPGEPLYASDYFEQLYQWAEHPDQRRPGLRRRPGRRDHPRAARRLRQARHREPVPRRAPSTRTSTCSAACAPASSPDGARVLRAKIDMQHENMQLRDPVMYRIRHGHHHRTGDAVGASTPRTTGRTARATPSRASPTRCARSSSTATAPLYDWYLEQLPLPGDQPRQTEFARLELTHTVTSKRKLAPAHRRRHRRRVGRSAPADAARPAPPRLPGRRAIRDFCTFIGVATHQQPPRRSSCSSRSSATS